MFEFGGRPLQAHGCMLNHPKIKTRRSHFASRLTNMGRGTGHDNLDENVREERLLCSKCTSGEASVWQALLYEYEYHLSNHTGHLLQKLTSTREASYKEPR